MLQNLLLDPPQTMDPHQRDLCSATPELLSAVEAQRHSLIASALHTVASLLVLWLQDPSEATGNAAGAKESEDSVAPLDTSVSCMEVCLGAGSVATSEGGWRGPPRPGRRGPADEVGVSTAREAEGPQDAKQRSREANNGHQSRLPLVLTCGQCGVMGTAALRCSRCRQAAYCGRCVCCTGGHRDDT